MPGKFLIDITDPRYQTAENADVIEFIRTANPFAHSDVGSIVFALGKEVPGAKAYSPAPRSYAYVVLHDANDRIVAIAFGQKGFALRLPPSSIDDAIAEGAVRAPKIGADWVMFDPWDVNDKNRNVKIRTWTERAVSESRT